MRPDHAAYIASWLNVLKNDKRFIFTAAAHAQRAADYLHGLQQRDVEQERAAAYAAPSGKSPKCPSPASLKSTAAAISGENWWLRHAQATPPAQQLTLFPLREDYRPPGERNAVERYREPSLFTVLERAE